MCSGNVRLRLYPVNLVSDPENTLFRLIRKGAKPIGSMAMAIDLIEARYEFADTFQK